MNDQNDETPNDQKQTEGPVIPIDLAELVDVEGMDNRHAAVIGMRFASANPGYAEQVKQRAATNLLTEVELSYCDSFNISPADYLKNKRAGSDADGS